MAMQFENFDVDHFLSEYWQKKPLFIKNPWKKWINPFGGDDAAGLACMEDVEARLIRQVSAEGDGTQYVLEHGPFAETRFAEIGAEPWTLLVQAADHYSAAAADLMTPFRFIPNWRMDDVMVSYASNGGGVGPHFDQYDVFLIQGEGQRRWQIGQVCDAASPLVPHDDLRLLAEFDVREEWLCGPGDIVYVPPGFAHNGVAVGNDCMTWSVGFRAPSADEMLGHWSDILFSDPAGDTRFADPGRQRQENPGEISAEAIDQLHKLVLDRVQDRAGFASWFGAYNTEPKYEGRDWRPETLLTETEMREILQTHPAITRNPASRFSYIRENADTILLFVDGETVRCNGDPAKFAQQLCAADMTYISPEYLSCDAILSLITKLYNAGSIEISKSDF